MTEQQAIAKLVSWCNGEVGYREGANNYNKYAAYLDTLKITFGNKQNLAWCGEFVLAAFCKCFGVDNGLKMLCSPNPTGIPVCANGAQYFKDKGRWTSRPAVGNVIFFIVKGGINHTGIVTGVSSLSVTTVEGNSSDRVQRNTYAIRDSKIAGYGIPMWSVVADSATDETEIPVEDSKPVDTSATEKLPVLRKGDISEAVRAAQALLNVRDCSVGKYGCDGDFGNATEAACLAFQRRNGLEADGVIGQQTWAKLLGIT